MVVHSNSALITSSNLLSVSSMLNLSSIEPEDHPEKLSQNSEDGEGQIPTSGVAKAQFFSGPNSHPFMERSVTLEKPVKIGRCVAKTKPSSNNAIFDCKVLSRNHALIWFSDDKFWLQDTKSSNGTFVNDERLNPGGLEGPPKEIFSRDTVKFGVEVVESGLKCKVTHGCIVASLRLFLPNGQEGKPSSKGPGGMAGCITTSDLYQLQQYIQEASNREKQLEAKLHMLREHLDRATDSSKAGWKALVDEDRVLSKLEGLEAQIQVYAKNLPEEKWSEELDKIREDKNIYQTKAKENMQKVVEEKLLLNQELEVLRRKLTNSTEQCEQLEQNVEFYRQELAELATTHEEQLTKGSELCKRVEELEEENERLVKKKEADDIVHIKNYLSEDGNGVNEVEKPVKQEEDGHNETMATSENDTSVENHEISNHVDDVVVKQEIVDHNEKKAEQIECNMETTVAALTEEKSVKLELEGRISELVKQLDEKNSEVKRLEELQIEKDKQLSDTQADLVSANAEVETVQRDMVASKKKAEEILHKKVEDVDRLSLELEGARKQATSLETRLSAFTSEKSTEIEAMKKQSETMRACLSTEEGQRRKLEEQLQKANEELTESQKKLRHRELENAELTQTLLSLEKTMTNKTTASLLSSTPERFTNGDETIDPDADLSLQISELDDRLSFARDEIRSLKEAYVTANEERSFLRRERDALQQDYRAIVKKERTVLAPLVLFWLGILLAFGYQRFLYPATSTDGDSPS